MAEWIYRYLYDESGAIVGYEYHGELIRCKDCKHWDRKDGMFPDIDGYDWHGCDELSAFVSASGDAPCTPAWWYCPNAERKEE